MKRPDVVGLTEAAAILATNTPQVIRWRDAGKMPPSAVCDADGERVTLASTSVWHASQVKAMAKGSPILDRPPLELVGLDAAARMLGLAHNKSQIGRWRRAGRFPKPCKELAAGPLWWASDIREFAADREAAAA